MKFPSINETGLLLYLDAGLKSSYPGSGATWKDLSGNGYHATLNGTTYSTSGGGSLVFNGTSDYGQTTATPFTANTDFTISTWVKNISTSASCILFGNKGMSGDGEGVCFQYYHTTPLVYVLIKTSGSYYNYQVIIPWGTSWNNIAMTRSGTSVRGYLNGVSVVGPGTVAGSVTDQYNYFTIGAEPDLIPKCNEAISQILVYQRALSAAEILQNYNATKSRFGL